MNTAAHPLLATLLLCALSTVSGQTLPPPAGPSAPATGGPRYDAQGRLLPPTGYREWIYLSTGFDMSYNPALRMGHHMFDNVFVDPESYRSFLQTGTWPDKTLLVLEGRQAEGTGSINKAGHFQSGPVMALEVHVRDDARFPGRWAFFEFGDTQAARQIPVTTSCYACHAAHGAVDTTFVQFYPTLLPLAQGKGTLSATYLKMRAELEGTLPGK